MGKIDDMYQKGSLLGYKERNYIQKSCLYQDDFWDNREFISSVESLSKLIIQQQIELNGEIRKYRILDQEQNPYAEPHDENDKLRLDRIYMNIRRSLG